MISKEAVRKILGKDCQNLTGSELEELAKNIDFISNLALDYVLDQRSSNNPPGILDETSNQAKNKAIPSEKERQ